MSDPYIDLLDATIHYLKDLQAKGTKWISLSPGILEQLSTPAPTRPAATPRSAAPPSDPVAAAQPLLVPSPGNDASAPVPAPAADKPWLIARLREAVLSCRQCQHLAASRKTVVFGVGDATSPLMFVGEAPGADEDTQGEPFVGAAGQLLTRIIKTMGFSRETVYIANVLKCRPDTPGQAYGNRKPTPEEMKTCLPYLREQINIIQPKVIVALGATAMEGLFGQATSISRARGHWHAFNQIPVMPTFHPSYLLRNQAPAVKRQVWEDMLLVLERLGNPISEKQRNYFKT